jgi:hypothetical protein
MEGEGEKKSVIRPLARWPAEPLPVSGVTSGGDAVREAQRKWDGKTMFRNTKVSQERFDELVKRPRPGQEKDYTSVNITWITKEVGTPGDDWEIAAIAHFTPAT